MVPGMTELKNDCLLRALLRQPTERTPVWVMRQAGRYLPEYRKIRQQAGSFMALCTNPELACEVTLQPLRRFPLDAAILFSDILTIPDAMGLGLYFEDGEGPRFRKPLRTAADVEALSVIDTAADLGYVLETVQRVRRELNGSVPLLGFSGSPWTLATYMVEGGSSKDFARVRDMARNQPEWLHHILGVLADSVSDYLRCQIEAGVQAVQLFDTWGGVLSTAAYREFSLPYLQRIVGAVPRRHQGRRVPLILFTRHGGQWLELMAATGADALGLDWTVPLAEARRRVGARVALQGNLDPQVLHGTPDRIRHQVQAVLASYGEGPGHVFNLGHGIGPQTRLANMSAMIEAVGEYSPRYHLARQAAAGNRSS